VLAVDTVAIFACGGGFLNARVIGLSAASTAPETQIVIQLTLRKLINGICHACAVVWGDILSKLRLRSNAFLVRHKVDRINHADNGHDNETRRS
jgi:hypothetical protein